MIRYETFYPEQIEYMLLLKEILETKEPKKHALIEMPTGTGKTACIFSTYLSIKHFNPSIGLYLISVFIFRKTYILHKNNNGVESVYGRIKKDCELSKENIGQ